MRTIAFALALALGLPSLARPADACGYYNPRPAAFAVQDGRVVFGPTTAEDHPEGTAQPMTLVGFGATRVVDLQRSVHHASRTEWFSVMELPARERGRFVLALAGKQPGARLAALATVTADDGTTTWRVPGTTFELVPSVTDGAEARPYLRVRRDGKDYSATRGAPLGVLTADEGTFLVTLADGHVTLMRLP